MLTVNAVNDVPTIGALADVQTSEDVPVMVSLLVGDVESTQLAVTGGSSNTNLLADTGMVMSGIGTNRVLTLSPATNQFGSTTVSVTVRDDDGASVSAIFVLTVLPVNDLPVISPLADLVVNMGTPAAPFGFTVEDVESDSRSARNDDERRSGDTKIWRFHSERARIICSRVQLERKLFRKYATPSQLPPDARHHLAAFRFREYAGHWRRNPPPAPGKFPRPRATAREDRPRPLRETPQYAKGG